MNLAAIHESSKLDTKPDASDSDAKRKGGRPRGGNALDIDWQLAETLYVQGEVQPAKIQGAAPYLKRFTMDELAVRLGCSKAAVGFRAAKYEWARKRQNFSRESFDTQAKKRAIAPTNPGSPPTRTALQILDVYIAMFGDAVDQGRVRVDDIGLLDKALRARAFVMGEIEQRTETKQVVTLEAIQGRHAETRRLMLEGDAEASGVMAEGEVAPSDE